MKQSVTVKRCGTNYIVLSLTNRILPMVGGVLYTDELKRLIEDAKENPNLTINVRAK